MLSPPSRFPHVAPLDASCDAGAMKQPPLVALVASCSLVVFGIVLCRPGICGCANQFSEKSEDFILGMIVLGLLGLPVSFVWMGIATLVDHRRRKLAAIPPTAGTR